MSTSNILSLPLIQSAQAQKHVTHNEALRVLDVLVQLSVVSADETMPPPGATDGDRYIVGAASTGDWSGHDHEIAVMEGATWQFFPALAGWRSDVTTSDTQIRFNGTGWEEVTIATDNLPQLGINAVANATNKLSISADASLFSNNGASHQMKINKAATADTASLLFQNNWTGHAEMGLAGNTDFSIKTSADGTTWHDALIATGDGDIGIGKTPDAKLDVDGVMRLTPVLSANLPAAGTIGAGGVAFVSDATGGAQLAYSDGTSWLKVADGTTI